MSRAVRQIGPIDRLHKGSIGPGLALCPGAWLLTFGALLLGLGALASGFWGLAPNFLAPTSKLLEALLLTFGAKVQTLWGLAPNVCGKALNFWRPGGRSPPGGRLNCRFQGTILNIRSRVMILNSGLVSTS